MSRRYTLGAVVPGAVLLASALVLGWHDANRPVVPTVATVIRGDVGEEIAVGGTRVEVTDVWATDVLEIEEGLSGEVRTATTPGRWLVVRVAFAGDVEPSSVKEFRWRDAEGVEYEVTGELALRGYELAQPGEWWHEDIVFEVPPEVATGGVLRIMPEGRDWDLPMQLGTVTVGDDEVVDVDRVAPLEPTIGRS